MKYVLVTGGVLSGIGKGIIASSTGMILKAMGYRVTSIKIDPYPLWFLYFSYFLRYFELIITSITLKISFISKKNRDIKVKGTN